jgi:C4-dicarboxylate transporter, DctM subunit
MVCCVFFAGMSGSGPADTAALGTILIPAMAARGYAKPFAAALIASGGSIAIIIPPSIAFIIYGVVTSTSIPALFAAGIVPGFVVGAALAVSALLLSRRHGWRGDRWGTPAEVLRATRESFWGLLAPLVILGGIDGGIFTATEAAVSRSSMRRSSASPSTGRSGSGISGRSPSNTAIASGVAALGLVASVPQLSTWLPRAFGLR